MRKYLLLLSLIAILTILPMASARDIYVDTSWMVNGDPVLINNLMDGDPNTLGKNGELDAEYGDTIHFATGTYQLPFEYGKRFRVLTSGIKIQGAGWDNTILRGPTITSGTVLEIRAENVTIAKLRTENSFLGIKIGSLNGEEFDGTNISFVKTIYHDQHYAWENQEAPQETIEPSIWLENIFLKEGEIGFHHIKGNGATMNTKYIGSRHGTSQELTKIVIDAPLAINDSGDPIFKGNDDFSDWIIQNGTTFRADLYLGMNSPTGFVEWNIDTDSLQDRGIGINNIEADPLLDSNGKPKRGSPAIGPQYTDGYAGAIPPNFVNTKAKPKILNPLEAEPIGGLIISFLY